MVGSGSHGNLPPLNLFIDALDESGEGDVRDMLTFFESAAEDAVSASRIFRLCFSTRHYPHISMGTGLSLVMERQPGHTLDIGSYVDRNFLGNDQVLSKIVRTNLLRKSEDVFLWVGLSLSLLKPLHDRGRINDLGRRMNQLPQGIYNLFATIIVQRPGNLEECISLLQWLVVAKVPLSAQEVYLAIR